MRAPLPVQNAKRAEKRAQKKAATVTFGAGC